MRIACIGEAMIELSMSGDTAQIGVAGDTLNTAIYLKRAAPDIEVDYITILGDDPFSDRIEQFIASHDIGTEQIRRMAGKSPGLYAINTRADGERSFTYWRDSSPARNLFRHTREYDLLETYDAIYLSGITMAILPGDVSRDLARHLNNNACYMDVIYDSNYRPQLWEDQDLAREITTQMWHRADVRLPSLDDEMALYGETAEERTSWLTGNQDGGCGAIKRGAQGPLSIGEPVVQEYPVVREVVDTTAAGDSFNGAYIAAHYSGADQADALMAGHLCASHVVQHRGAIVPPPAG